MVSMEQHMSNLPDDGGRNGRRTIWIMLAVVGIIVTGGAVAGFLGQHDADGGGPLAPAGIAVLATFFLIIAGLGYAIWRQAQLIRLSGVLQTSREKRSNRIIIACGLIGGLLGLGLVVGSDLGGGPPDVFSNAPIIPAFALGLALVVGILMPIISWYWHNRVIDELEADAYRSGALIAIYAYWTISPTWWVLWRGGLVPAPDGIAIYMITIFTALFIWFWKKYR
jgi:hypothetical protein